MADYTKMTDEELVALNQELMAQKASIREQQLEITAVLDARKIEADEERRLQNLTDEEREIVISAKTAKMKAAGKKT